MRVKSEKKHARIRTSDGFEMLKVTANLSMPCWKCNKLPKEFYWKSHGIKKSEVYCVECPRG